MSDSITDTQSTLPDEHARKKEKHTSVFKALFQILKKFIDEEIWYIARHVIPKFIAKPLNPFMVGGLMLFVLAQEAYEGVKDVIEAISDRQAKQRLTRIVAGTSILGLALAGGGLCFTMLAEALGASPAGAFAIPVILPTLMVAIYSISLARKSYTLHIARQKEAEQRALYENYIYEKDKEIARIKRNLLQLRQALVKTEENLTASYTGPSDSTVTSQLVTAKISLENEIKQEEGVIDALEAQKKAREEEYHPFLEERLDAEREVGFAVAELATSAAVLVSAILGASFIVGASVASFGTLALAILITGAAVGGAIKLFEYIDERKDHAMTKWIRNLFTFSHKPKPIIENDEQIKPIEVPKPTAPMDIKGSTSKILSTIPIQPEASVPNPDLASVDEGIDWEADYPNFAVPKRYEQKRNQFFTPTEEIRTKPGKESAFSKPSTPSVSTLVDQADVVSENELTQAQTPTYKPGPPCVII